MSTKPSSRWSRFQLVGARNEVAVAVFVSNFVDGAGACARSPAVSLRAAGTSATGRPWPRPG